MSVVLFSAVLATAQTASYTYRDPADSTRNCYLTIVPDDSPKGLVVRDYTRLPDTSVASPFQFTDLMVDAGWAVVYTVTSTTYPDLYYHDAGPRLLDSIVHEVMEAHNVDPEHLVIGGISASGTRALRYAQWCEQGKSPFGHRVAGAFAVDPPLDLERFYRSSDRIIDRNNPYSDRREAQLILKVFPEQLGGSPDEVPAAYHAASVYARRAADGGNAGLLMDVPVLLYHEPDVEWWVVQRAADWFDFNSVDIVGLYHAIRDMGSTSIELITTHGQGFDRQGEAEAPFLDHCR